MVLYIYNMQEIISPIAIKLLLQEMNADTFVRKTNKGDNEIYIFDHRNAPNLTKEIGRLREVTFRAAGGGTGKSLDLDAFDLDTDAPYCQLIVWSPEFQEIVGGYRFIKCKDAKIDNGIPNLATAHLLNFSETFLTEYYPYVIELGRSFVQPHFQPSATNRIGLFSLDNLWDGLGALIVDNPDMKYFFGKVTMYLDFDKRARDLILSFMKFYFPDPDELLRPKKPLALHTDTTDFIKSLEGLDYKQGHKVLNGLVRDLNENIPPLINSYMNLSPTMKSFGTALNDHFGDVEESGILVTIADIYKSKSDRHVDSYKKG